MDTDNIIVAAARTYGLAEGAKDYQSRAADVAAGVQPADWAWPLVLADDPAGEYISAVTREAICAAVLAVADLDDEEGFDDSDLWDEIREPFCLAWCEGYERAHAGEVQS